MQTLLGYNFWFRQPSTILLNADYIFGYLFLGLVVLAIIFRILVWFSKNKVNKKVFERVWHLNLTIGLLGLVWFAFRYENSPFLSFRIWNGVVLLIGIIWLGFICKYLILNFAKEKRELRQQQIKNKYMPQSR